MCLDKIAILSVFIHHFFAGFSCFKCFFENVNQHEHKLKKSAAGFVSHL